MTYKVLPKPAHTNKQINEYLSDISHGVNGRFVVPNGKGWYVRKPDSHEGTLFPTRAKAIVHAEQELKTTKGELFVFDKNGHLTERQS